MKKRLFKKTLAFLAVVTACLLVAATPLSPVPGTEESGETVEVGGGETEPGIEPQNDDNANRNVKK